MGALARKRAAAAGRFARKLGAVVCAAALAFGLVGCAAGDAGSGTGVSAAESAGGAAAQPLTETLFAFDTSITLTAYCDVSLMQQAVDRCRYFEERFSRTREGSDVWNINEAAGQPVEVAPETADIIARGLEWGAATDGLFDITIGAVSSLWDFKEGVRPADEALAEAVRHVDYRGVEVDGTTVTLADPAAMIDLGGLAKGYIADDLAQLFREGACESATINLGGNVYALGAKPDGAPWRVGIQDPNAPTDAGVVAVLPCENTSVVTSGLYERQFQLDGQLYYHILDPRTGYPVETDLESASVASASSLEGDVVATWLFLMGRDEALAYLGSQPGLEGLLIDADGTIVTTPGSAFELR